MIPPEQGTMPSDRISNFHRTAITEAWVCSCSRILETKEKKKTKQSKTKIWSNGAEVVLRIKEYGYKTEESEEWTALKEQRR